MVLENESTEDEAPHKPADEETWRRAYGATFAALARILGTRVILLLAASGAFALSWRALSIGTETALAGSLIYELGVFLPAIVLAIRAK